MPYKSLAQAAKFHILEKQGKISHKTVEEFDNASRGMKLPKKAKYSPWSRMHGNSKKVRGY